MPEDLTDRSTCHNCHKQERRDNNKKKKNQKKKSKKLSKCARCHAITYCSAECQVADWARHVWNCVPVMVTEIPGKGRGLVAARKIKMGELIFTDKPTIRIPSNSLKLSAGQMLMESLKTQIGDLPTEAKSQFYKLTAAITDPYMSAFISILAARNENDSLALKLFMANALTNRKGKYFSLYLNLSLVNHSCAPNAAEAEQLQEVWIEDQVPNCELRAIKDISRGEEITICYVDNIRRFGIGSDQRKAGIWRELTFNCVCSVCSGQVSDQEDILTRLSELHHKLNPFHLTEIVTGFEKWEARIQAEIVDLTMKLYIGKPDDKIRALDVLARTAHLAREEKLVRKAMTTWRQLADDTNLLDIKRTCQILESSLHQWSIELKLRSRPKQREIDFIHNISLYDKTSTLKVVRSFSR